MLLNPLVPIRTMWRYRQLIWQFTLRNVEMRHKGSVLGVVWAVLNPLLMLLAVLIAGFIAALIPVRAATKKSVLAGLRDE